MLEWGERKNVVVLKV